MERKYQKQGFLNQFSLSSIENDFNSFAKVAFLGPGGGRGGLAGGVIKSFKKKKISAGQMEFAESVMRFKQIEKKFILFV